MKFSDDVLGRYQEYMWRSRRNDFIHENSHSEELRRYMEMDTILEDLQSKDFDIPDDSRLPDDLFEL